MYCNKCGKEYTNDYKFCVDCGNKLEEKNVNNDDIKIEKKEKVNPKDLELSAKVGYYTRKITIVTFLLYAVLLIVLFCVQFIELFKTGGEEGAGWLIFIIVLFILPFIIAYFVVASLFNIILPSVWIEKNKKVGTTAEVFRFIGLVVGYILLYLPLIIGVIYLISNFKK